MSEPIKAPGAVPQIQVDIDDVTAQGAFTNLVLLNHNDSEFVLDFAYVQPTSNRARVRARILATPRHAKRLLRALELNIRRYEENYGTIPEPETGPPGNAPS
jgi:hypothetical protein